METVLLLALASTCGVRGCDKYILLADWQDRLGGGVSSCIQMFMKCQCAGVSVPNTAVVSFVFNVAIYY